MEEKTSRKWSTRLSWTWTADARAGGNAAAKAGKQDTSLRKRHLKKSSSHLQQPKPMRYQFIDTHREVYPVQRMCKVLKVSSSGYYSWRKRVPSERDMANQEIVEQIKTIHEGSYETYGSPRIYKELQENEIDCGENRVARLMKANDIRAKQPKKRKLTTKANKKHPKAPNLLDLLDREFAASRPNEKWTTDITYVPTSEGWLYLAVVLDLFSRRIVGWAMSARMTSDLVVSALNMAIAQRQPKPGLLHHSDRGSQYTGNAYTKVLSDNLMLSSMSRTGNCWDNAVSESLFGTVKIELTHHRSYETRREAKSDIFFYIESLYNRRRRHYRSYETCREAKSDIFFYIESLYNRRRRHSTLGYVSLGAYEAVFYKHQAVLT